MAETVIVLYDGDCGICSWSRDFAEVRDAGKVLRFVPYQVADLEALSPGLTLEQASRMAWVIKPDGTRYGGARAVFEVLRRLPGRWGVLGRIGANPVISAIFTPPYRLMAVQRRRISMWLGMNACALPEQKPVYSATSSKNSNEQSTTHLSGLGNRHSAALCHHAAA